MGKNIFDFLFCSTPGHQACRYPQSGQFAKLDKNNATVCSLSLPWNMFYLSCLPQFRNTETCSFQSPGFSIQANMKTFDVFIVFTFVLIGSLSFPVCLAKLARHSKQPRIIIFVHPIQYRCFCSFHFFHIVLIHSMFNGCFSCFPLR